MCLTKRKVVNKSESSFLRSQSNCSRVLGLISVSAFLAFLSSWIISSGFQEFCKSFVINRFVNILACYTTISSFTTKIWTIGYFNWRLYIYWYYFRWNQVAAIWTNHFHLVRLADAMQNILAQWIGKISPQSIVIVQIHISYYKKLR